MHFIFLYLNILILSFILNFVKKINKGKYVVSISIIYTLTLDLLYIMLFNVHLITYRNAGFYIFSFFHLAIHMNNFIEIYKSDLLLYTELIWHLIDLLCMFVYFKNLIFILGMFLYVNSNFDNRYVIGSISFYIAIVINYFRYIHTLNVLNYIDLSFGALIYLYVVFYHYNKHTVRYKINPKYDLTKCLNYPEGLAFIIRSLLFS